MAKKPTTSSERVYFTSGDNALPLPNLIAHQKDSWRWFVEEGLSEIFSEINPIDDYTGQKLSLKFGKYYFGEPKNTDQFAKENNLTFEAPLHATVELTNKTTGVVEEQEIYLGEYPWMTERGTFIINGTERVVVSQLIRSAGVFFTAETVAGRNYYGAKIIPGRGAWMEFETASNGAIYVKIDRRRKMPATTLLRALGYPKTSEIKELFADIDTGDVKYIDETLDKDTSRGANEALIEVYRRLRPGDLATVDNARQMIERMFFDFKRFDYSRVGRYKLNQRLGLDVANTAENRTLQMSDLVAILREVIRLNNTQEPADDIDALSNRRVRLVGELIARQFRVGMLRMQRNAMDRMSVADLESVSPSQLINARPIVAAVREFFTSSQLSQLLDEVNPLSELSHKRRLSSTGPGGLTRERAGFEVRDAHPTHYGRICSVETPEGANIGLVLNLAAYARVNEYGFIETPYLRVKDGKVTDELVYLDASQEIGEVIADAGEALNEDGTFRDERVNARSNMQPSQVDANQVTFMDAAHRQILGSTAALVPFIEKTRVDRALTGSNMQRQAVPLLCPESATVGTGIEKAVAENSGHLIQASGDGEVVRADADEVHVKYADGVKIYTLKHFVKNNDDRCYNQKVRVERGDKVKKGDILIEGASIAGGEIALGKNLLVAFMPWGGYNMEDAIIMSRRLVEDDRLTSINIKDYTVEVRETKLGPEIVTRDIPNVSEESLRHLDENGIVQIGSEVKAGDVLVGKITPKGEQELSSEERLLRAIFGEKAKDVRDTSQRMNNAGGGKVVGVKIFSRENGHELKAGVLMQIQIFVAQLRKIGVGDKMAGRFGNKGVVAKVLPVEDMPFLEDGTPVDVVLNPLGVPSRMNLGQIFETHLGMAARALGYRVATPSFNGVPSEKISDELEKAGLARDGKSQLFDGRTGEPFEERTTVGVMHMIKLHHMVSDKIHARSTGPYTMVTQQPLGGKAQNGGQRFGEMEVWALEAYGAAATLQEMLTIKSDDVYGRAKAYESIIKDEPIVGPKLPESFNVLVKELQGLGLRVDLVDDEATVDAEHVIASSGPEDKTVAADNEEEETYLDESDDIGEIDDGMSVQDIDEVEEIKEDA
ncbi:MULTISPECIES: DNA-directed RNA polymerase subunit beta [unclassified Candidatus Nanosynbacter]|uniref:DNA-directed RNA polymerase subunit beta n=1 Tax=unclassified Candidatus Nanosynbacter TaxID=2725944 RepID=UPI001FB7EE4D|nr:MULTISPECIES: DNA-directed RNA polymerase subunit beta [unclassified Candidatus Nanosynbacter]MCJ1963328.1 DNA-directed RNA polymerase subunit beta [Candidatus Nanosynbacter sp. TM7-033]UOG67817.1 DNA-directed RNA polymerase subunit beta [Candidatus Nanosynbacter sp. HMT-352]